MRFLVLSFLLILACLYLTMAQGSFDDCCLKYSPEVRQNIKRRVVKYRMQETDGGCNIAATVFTLKKGRQFCGDPHSRWVKDLMRKVDIKIQKTNLLKKVKWRKMKFISASFSPNMHHGNQREADKIK
ncbi:C-C motif chemokine 25 [Merluccius polli]|uniref:C-C motif chemokine 25 n=1 Tax=Merluccius polli TaxID=89951 RepID=A0AA47NVW3_MERPO|nr:C-C motif chemokine 25 [Merluccius polli]